MARGLNLDGDGQADLRGHGGENRAMLVYQIESYRYWQQQLGDAPYEMGRFGRTEMPSLLVQHGRPGFYVRVLEEGTNGAGDRIEFVSGDSSKMSVTEIVASRRAKRGFSLQEEQSWDFHGNKARCHREQLVGF
jgi:MOSC domain-containing protein YiiM